MLESLSQYIPFIVLASLILVLIVLVWSVFLHRQARALTRRLAVLTQGAEGQNWEEILKGYLAAIQRTEAKVDQLAEVSEEISRRLPHSIQGVGVVRFNAFPDIGGEQSFAIALLDGQGDGVVISSLKGRNETHIYAKPLKGWDSTHHLSEEEKRAMAKARGRTQ